MNEENIEMSEFLETMSGDRLAWLVMKCPELLRLEENGPGSILIAEMLRRIFPEISDYEISRDGWFGLEMTDHIIYED